MGLALIPGFGSLGGTELIIALVIILLLFGAKRIPELAKGLGSGVREFRKGTKGDYDEVEEEKKKKDGEITGEKEESSEAQDSETSEPESRLQRDASAEADRDEQEKS